MIFNIGDLVRLHLRKDRFPNERKSKLLPRADGPFKVLARYNDNAYKIELPRDKYTVSDIFNVKDLSPFHGDEDFDPRSDLSQGRGDDAEHPSIIPMDSTSTTLAPRGPMTRARARAIQSEVNSLLVELPFDPFETWLLPQTETLCVLRYHVSSQGEGVVQDGHQDQGGIPPSLGGPVQPPHHRPGGTTGQPPPNNRPLFCEQAVQGRYSTGSTGFCPKTGTTAPTSGTTAGSFDAHLQEPVPDLPAVVPPSSTGTTAPHELSAVLPAP